MSMESTQCRVYLDAQKNCGFKPGDYARVLTAACENEAGWDGCWNNDKQSMIGSICRVLSVNSSGVLLESLRNGNDCMREYFPYFVLEPAKKPVWKPQPFERVLMREAGTRMWKAGLYSHTTTVNHTHCTMCHGRALECIPYAGNEKLLGTCHDPEE